MTASTPDYDVLQRSLDVLLELGETETAAHVAKSLGIFWETDGYLVEGSAYLTTILDAPTAEDLAPDLTAALHLSAGNLLRHQGQYDRAASYYSAGRSRVNADSDPLVLTSILSGLGEIAFRQGNYDAATVYYQQHLTISQEAAIPLKIADAMNALGRLATVQQDWSAALDYHDYGQHLSQQHGYRMGIAWSLNALGELERARKNYRRATALFRDSADLFKMAHNPGAYYLAHSNLAFALLACGDSVTAEGLFFPVLDFRKKGNALHGIALCLIGFADVSLIKGRNGDAALLLAFAERLIGQIGVQLELGDRHDYEQTMTKLAERLSEAEYQTIANRAQHLTLDELFSHTPLFRTLPRSRPMLTVREIDILRSVAAGLTDKQIAASLTISAHTVNAHLRSIYRKLDVNTRTAAVTLAQRYSLL